VQITISDKIKSGENLNCLPATIEHVTFLGEMIYYHVRLENGANLLVPVYNFSSRYQEDDKIFIYWDIHSGKILTK
jgi:hypothetical protein